MNVIYSCIIAISMYSKIPMPQVDWTPERMRHIMCFFPIVGLLEGLCLGGWFYIALEVMGFSVGMTSLVGAAVPVLVTGGIHLDGFLDTMDAIHSYGDRAKKLEILKDPHVGAFAVISAVAYALLYAGVLWEYVSMVAVRGREDMAAYVFPMWLFTMERAFSGLSVLTFPSAKKDGLAASFAQAAEKKKGSQVLILWLLVLAAAAFAFLKGKGAGLVCLTAAVQLAVFVYYRRMSDRDFGGITGDLAGWFLQVCELASMGAAVVYLKMW
ncbi:adenosylcobinamide-GDP ribazoletransferase [Lacrimispora sp. 210928-DFI.3.58]|mgnify:CR=1 FL=1|uniref:adenosylcobinamide-GDP ribazoletransferase n=1 Tax=Lacrimispora sp. 210928-DFI.3.58 TaxID=2883214 RepID=UPI0015B5FCFE|nr:adenosylcobinamide-GDP ribazoletransferase [Lacrimispora sp. 210928-DFI.3.58]MCB7319826.1 adenosylcobinamide-GDP ribazoletransferase [Lacrimispora sp. 210928-DFI.3.58]